MRLEIHAEIVSDVWLHVVDFWTSSYFLLWMEVVPGARGRMVYWPLCEVEQVCWSRPALSVGMERLGLWIGEPIVF
jgi:hypothetical protein